MTCHVRDKEKMCFMLLPIVLTHCMCRDKLSDHEPQKRRKKLMMSCSVSMGRQEKSSEEDSCNVELKIINKLILE